MQIRDWMTHPVHTVSMGTPLGACAERMRTGNFRHLPVVDDEGRCRGVLSDYAFEMRGLFMSGRWVPFDDTDTWLLAEQVAHVPDVRCRPDDPLLDSLKRLKASYQDYLIVIDDGERPVGIFTEHDAVVRACTLLPETDVSLVARTELPLMEDHTSAADARSWMARHQHRHVLMIDGEGKLKGVLSYRDVALEEAIQDVSLRDVAHRPLARQRPLSAREAAIVLRDSKIGCLPLVDEANRPVEVITRREILDAVIAQLSA